MLFQDCFSVTRVISFEGRTIRNPGREGVGVEGVGGDNSPQKIPAREIFPKTKIRASSTPCKVVHLPHGKKIPAANFDLKKKLCTGNFLTPLPGFLMVRP